jgi:hypothetical protein
MPRIHGRAASLQITIAPRRLCGSKSSRCAIVVTERGAAPGASESRETSAARLGAREEDRRGEPHGVRPGPIAFGGGGAFRSRVST